MPLMTNGLASRVPGFLRAPRFADEDTDRASRLVHVVTIIVLISMSIATARGMLSPTPAPHRWFSTPLLLGVMVLTQWLLRKGRVRLASYVFITTLFMVPTVLMFLSGGLESAMAVGLLGPIVIAALLISARAATFYAATAVAILFVVHVLGELDLLPPPIAVFGPFYTWMMLSGTMIITVYLTHVTTDVLRHSRSRARRNEAAERERARLAEELEHARKVESLGLLAGGVAHDFNNLLTIILSTTALLRRQLPADSPSRQDVENIASAGTQAAELTRQLLAFARKQVRQERMVDLDRMTRELLKMLRRIIGEDVELRFQGSGHPIPIVADPGQIEQVVVNLVLNARDAMPDGGTLTLEVEHATGLDGRSLARLRVRDTGCGIDEQVLPRIFDPFFTTKEHGRGTGLGLAVVQGIVEQTRGQIGVESRPGSGTTVTIDFPLAESWKADSGEVPTRGGQQSSATVLLVEDEIAVRTVLERILVDGGFRVLVAGDGEEAMSIVDRELTTIDLVVTDCVMPKLGGAELVERLRRTRPELPVVMMSGYADRVPAIGRGVSFLAKPLTPEDLLLKVHKALSRRHARPRATAS